MKKIFVFVGVISLLIVSTSNSLADSKHKRRNNHEHMARVTHVETIYRSVRVSTPQRECYHQPRQRSRHSKTHSYTSTITGGLIGGVIGNQFGGGNGKTMMTVAGTLLGGSIGRDIAYQNNTLGYDREKQCYISKRYRQEQHIDGYEVTYRYQGQYYTTKMKQYPGKRIPVEVSVRPVRNYY
ncbi:glycine zipper 2TM domain-containing protein [Pseudomonadota bacterium]|nr:glycine zipper 2TM domain-containing protein [Pseudomonadota bacterium]